ncbi:MAG: low-specificity L-threonine aldolase [Dehalococcoidales bacterium]|nr:low-specificity L-threonine aldolase [Dehalococcoidales bacterium]
MKMIDLRSDTVTHPTEAMRQAMYEAEVGDDVYGEDPSINKLEMMAAAKVGKAAGLFVPSGTMSNLLAILVQTTRGNEIIVGSESHIFHYEVGGASALGGVVLRTVNNQPHGEIELEDIEKSIRSQDIHSPPTALICLENTQNRCGGMVLTPFYTAKVVKLARAHNLKVHLDGARLFNAAVAQNVSAMELSRGVDSVGICLSKGLSAPVGSVICGSSEFIERARKWRKMLGGGMRQAGVIAAAGIVALETMVERLAEDHANAKKLAEGMRTIKDIIVTQDIVPTNIILFETAKNIDAVKFSAKMKAEGVLLSPRGGNQFRVVTHRMVSTADIDTVLMTFTKVIKNLKS